MKHVKTKLTAGALFSLMGLFFSISATASENCPGGYWQVTATDLHVRHGKKAILGQLNPSSPLICALEYKSNGRVIFNYNGKRARAFSGNGWMKRVEPPTAAASVSPVVQAQSAVPVPTFRPAPSRPSHRSAEDFSRAPRSEETSASARLAPAASESGIGTYKVSLSQGLLIHAENSNGSASGRRVVAGRRGLSQGNHLNVTKIEDGWAHFTHGGRSYKVVASGLEPLQVPVPTFRPREAQSTSVAQAENPSSDQTPSADAQETSSPVEAQPAVQAQAEEPSVQESQVQESPAVVASTPAEASVEEAAPVAKTSETQPSEKVATAASVPLPTPAPRPSATAAVQKKSVASTQEKNQPSAPAPSFESEPGTYEATQTLRFLDATTGKPANLSIGGESYGGLGAGQKMPIYKTSADGYGYFKFAGEDYKVKLDKVKLVKRTPASAAIAQASALDGQAILNAENARRSALKRTAAVREPASTDETTLEDRLANPKVPLTRLAQEVNAPRAKSTYEELMEKSKTQAAASETAAVKAVEESNEVAVDEPQSKRSQAVASTIAGKELQSLESQIPLHVQAQQEGLDDTVGPQPPIDPAIVKRTPLPRPPIDPNIVKQSPDIRYAYQAPLCGCNNKESKCYLTSGFGGRKSPGGVGSRYHPAIDFSHGRGHGYAASVAPGQVIDIGNNGGYGYQVAIKHDDGMISIYNHCKSNSSPLKIGERVDQNVKVCQIGATGIGTAAHLDFKLLDSRVSYSECRRRAPSAYAANKISSKIVVKRRRNGSASQRQYMGCAVDPLPFVVGDDAGYAQMLNGRTRRLFESRACTDNTERGEYYKNNSHLANRTNLGVN